MHRLTGADAGFLALELPNQPTHHVSLLLLGPREPGSPAQVTLDDLRSGVASHLDELPALRWRVKRVPLGWHHPVAFDDPAFDLDAHLSSVTLPAPGGPEELDRLVASLAERCLDRSRPLWHMTLVDGMDDGRQAIVVQMHHCLMDGAALMNAYACIFSAEEQGPASDEAPPALDRALARRPDREPGRFRLLTGALRDHLRATLRLPRLILRSIRGGTALTARVAASTMQLPVAGVDTPGCSLNMGAGPGRHFARTVLPLPEVRLVKEVAGATVNDVAMALCAGALRSFLQDHDALPGKPLIACIPVGLRPTSPAPHTSGNQWAIMTTPLATDVADPWERLVSIAAAARESKARLDLIGRELLRDWTEYLHPWVAEPAARRQQARLAAGKERVACNVTVSNLRGPAAPWSMAGAVVEELYFTGPPINRLGVVFVLADQAERLCFGILSVAGSVDDPGALAAGLHTSLRELVKAAEARRG